MNHVAAGNGDMRRKSGIRCDKFRIGSAQPLIHHLLRPEAAVFAQAEIDRLKPVFRGIGTELVIIPVEQDLSVGIHESKHLGLGFQDAVPVL